VQVNRGYCTMARRLPTMVAAVLLVGLCHAGGNTLSVPALATEARLSIAQAPASRRTDADKPDGSTAITRGMGKEAVRTVWGEPEEIRKIRTCFGWQKDRQDSPGGEAPGHDRYQSRWQESLRHQSR
jgi:hypothetical protein